VYTHFANADDESDTLTDQQIEKFRTMSAQIRAQKRHLANSAATLRGVIEGDYVRVGVALFGAEVVGERLEPLLRWRTEIARLKDLPPGHGIGYGTTFHTLRPSRIATLPSVTPMATTENSPTTRRCWFAGIARRSSAASRWIS